MGPYPVLDDPIAVINSRYYDNFCFFKSRRRLILLGMRDEKSAEREFRMLLAISFSIVSYCTTNSR